MSKNCGCQIVALILKIAGAGAKAPVLKRPLRLRTYHYESMNFSYCVLEFEAINYRYYYNHQYLKGGLFCVILHYMYQKII